MKKKQNLAFVDHPFHKNTQSSIFLRNILKKKYNITNIWKHNCTYQELKKYDVIVFWQYFIDFNNLIKLNKKKIIWVPMYDSLNNFDRNIFKICSMFKNISILSFSKNISKICIKEKISYLDLNYMKKPINVKLNKKFNILFWYRGNVKIKDWINTVNGLKYDNIFYYELIDPSYKRENLTMSFIKENRIKIIKSNYKKNNHIFLKYLKSSSVFVAPRIKEGIGMSIIEAMRYCKFIIGYDENTLNQYIINNKLGIFYNKLNKKIQSKNQIIKNKMYRFKYYNKIYLEWKKQELQIIKFLKFTESSNFKKSLNFYIFYVLNVLFNIKIYLTKFLLQFLILKKNF